MNVAQCLPVVLKHLRTMNEAQALFTTVMALPMTGWSGEMVFHHLRELLAVHKGKQSRILSASPLPLARLLSKPLPPRIPHTVSECETDDTTVVYVALVYRKQESFS